MAYEQEELFSADMIADIGVSVQHPAGVLLDENGNPVLDENNEPVYQKDSP